MRFIAVRGAALGVLGTLIVALAPPHAAAQGGRASARLVTSYFHTDNFFYEQADPTRAHGVIFRPELAFTTQTAKVEFDLGARGEAAMFSIPGSADDYIDGTGVAALAWTPTYRNRFGLDGVAQHGHDPWGLDRTEETPSETADVDEWKQTGGGVRYRYGAPNARVNAELGLRTMEKTYQTNRPATEFLDYQTNQVDYALAYNVTPKTAAVVGFTRTDIDFHRAFDNNAGPGGSDLDTRSGNLYQARAGARWLATAKTSGDVRFGYRQRTFDTGSDDVEGLDWSVGVQWSPTPPMVIELRTSRDEQQSYRADTDTIDQRTVSLKTRHHLTTRTRLTAGFDHATSAFHPSPRKDELRRFTLGLEYRASTWLFWTTELGYDTRTSSDATRDYDRLTATLGLGFGRPTQ